MATIKFKRGAGQPTGLTAYEPAWDTTNNRFFINNGVTALWVGAKVENDTSLGGAGASAFVLPTQLSVKTYVDNVVAGGAVSSVDGVTGAVDLLAGSGILITNPTGSGKGITLTNIGVLSFNGSTGAVQGVASINGLTGVVTNVARTNTTNTFSQLQSLQGGADILSGATVTDILRIRGSITDPGGKIELWDEANTYKATLQQEAATFKNTTFEFGGSDGFVVAANTDGATIGWVVKSAGSGVSNIWVNPSDSTTGITSFKSLRSDRLFTQETVSGSYQIALSGGKTGYQDYYTEDLLTWNKTTQLLTVTNINVTGGLTAPNTVNRIIPGTGIQVSGSTGNVTITNIGVQSLSGTPNQITVSTGTTGALTLSLPSAITAPGSLTVTGNLTVNGTTTTVNSNTLTVQDPIINIGGLTNGSPPVDTKDRGIAFQYYTGTTSATGYFGYDQSKTRFIYVPNASITNETVSGTAGVAEFSGIVAPQGVLTLQGVSGIGAGTITLNATDTLNTLNTYNANLHRFTDGTLLEGGGTIQLVSNNLNNYGTIITSAATDVGRTFVMPDISGTAVVAFSGGATSGWILRAAGSSTVNTWINPTAAGFTAFAATNAVNQLIQGTKSAGTYGVLFALGTGYRDVFLDSSNDITWNTTTNTLTVGAGNGKFEGIVDGGGF